MGETVVVIGGLAESLVNFRGPLLHALVARGCRVITMAAPDPTIARRLAALGIAFEPLPLARAGLNPFEDLRLLATLITRLREIRPDRVLSYTIKPVIYGGLAASLAGVPRIAAMITGLGYAFLGTGSKRTAVRRVAVSLYRLALRRTHVVFFQNPDDRDTFARLGITSVRNDIRLISGSGVDTWHYAPAPLPASPAFLMIARLLADKGVREYAAAARQLHATHPGVPCRLAGMLDPNPAAIGEAELRGWIDRGDVEFLGALEDVRPAIARASVYVLPSYREGTPRTVLEAMSMGRPIVTTDAPGCRQTIVDGSSGLLVPIADAHALAAAMRRFVEDPTLAARYGMAARARACEVFDVRGVNDAVIDALALGGSAAATMEQPA